MAGLYGDLPQAKHTTGDGTEWGGLPKLQPNLKPKSTLLAPPPSLLRPGRGAGRGSGPGRGRGGAGAAAAAADGAAGETQGLGAGTGGGAREVHSLFTSVQDEYDPMKPNDYEEVLKQRAQAKREAEAEAERLARVREMEEAMEKLRQQEEGPASDTARAAQLNISGEEAYLRRGRAGSTTSDSSATTTTGGLGLGAPGLGLGAGGSAAASVGGDMGDKGEKGMTLAQKLLMKMGWKEGEGLGRERQGISTPLVMQKTNLRGGVIVNAEPVTNPSTSAAQPAAAAGAGAASTGLPLPPPVQGAAGLLPGPPPGSKPRVGTIVGKPSKVLCLRNMVGPGEVDEELDEEVGIECTKYGNVTSVMIFEVTQPGYPAEEAVRIFVQFDREESAMKALIALQGRFFGGREVRGAFFSEERFAGNDLAPKAGEFD